MKKLLSILIVPLFIIFFMEVFCCLGHASPGMMGYTGGGASCTSNCPHTINLSPAANADEYEIYYSGSAWTSYAVSNNLAAGDLNTLNYYKMGVSTIFKNANIPSNATITSAYITYTADQAYSGTVSCYITGELSATPAQFTTVAGYQAKRGTVVGGANNNYITSSVNWSITGAWSTNGTYQSPSLATLIQAIINSVGAITDIRLWTDDHAGRSGGNLLRTWYSYAENSSKKSIMHIEYTTP
jgi:hypothetical protein